MRAVFLLSTVAPLLLLALQQVTSAASNICCSPNQWESEMSDLQVGRYPSSGFGRVAYDYTNKLLALNQTFISGSGAKASSRMLVDGKASKAYQVDGTTGRCIVMTGADVLQQCVPSFFKYQTTLTYGDSSGQLIGNVYQITSSQGGGNTTYVATKKLCSPVFVTTTYGSHLITSSMFNMTMGIRDRSVFNIPPECSGDVPKGSAGNPRLRYMRQLRSAKQQHLCFTFGLCGMDYAKFMP